MHFAIHLSLKNPWPDCYSSARVTNWTLECWEAVLQAQPQITPNLCWFLWISAEWAKEKLLAVASMEMQPEQDTQPERQVYHQRLSQSHPAAAQLCQGHRMSAERFPHLKWAMKLILDGNRRLTSGSSAQVTPQPSQTAAQRRVKMRFWIWLRFYCMAFAQILRLCMKILPLWGCNKEKLVHDMPTVLRLHVSY